MGRLGTRRSHLLVVPLITIGGWHHQQRGAGEPAGRDSNPTAWRSVVLLLVADTLSDPLRNRTQYYYLTGAPAPYYPSGNHGSATATGTATVSWRRAYYDGQAGDRMRSSGTELWALWTGWIVLGSVLPSIIAFMVSPLSFQTATHMPCRDLWGKRYSVLRP